MTVAAASASPQQLSLALTEVGPSEMAVTWVSLDPWSPQSRGSATYYYMPPAGQGSSVPVLPPTFPATTSTYSAGFGWNGTLFWAVLTGLMPGATYSYVVTSNDATSTTRTFKAAPRPNASATARIAVLADMGTIELLGFEVAAELIREHTIEPFDMTFIAGDLSYATVDPPNFEIQGLWDAWGQQNEPFTSTAPFMMTVGNHESSPGTMTNGTGTYAQPFAAFTSRYRMPRNGRANYYYWYDYACARFISINTEEDLSEGSAQWTWLDATLAETDRTITPWLFVSMHRPILSSDAAEASAHVPGAPLSAALEPLLQKYAVDVVFQVRGGLHACGLRMGGDIVAARHPRFIHACNTRLLEAVLLRRTTPAHSLTHPVDRSQGHQHVYERSAAQFNGTVVGLPDAGGTYWAPRAPVFIVQATSGAVLDTTWITPTPAWSLVRFSEYGFGRLTLAPAATGGNATLHYTFVNTSGFVLDSWSIIKAGVAAAVA